VNAEDFLQLVLHPENVSVTDLQALEELNHLFPYSQLVHFLVAKVYHDIGSQQSLPRIKRAAIYATHREALKALLDKKPQSLLKEKSLNLTDYKPEESSKEKTDKQELTDTNVSVSEETNKSRPKVNPDTNLFSRNKSNFITLETELELTVDDSSFNTNTVENELKNLVEEVVNKKTVPDFGSLETEDSVNDFFLKQIPDFGFDKTENEDEEPPLKVGFLNADDLEQETDTVANSKLGKDAQMAIIDNFIKKEPRISPLTYKDENIEKKDLSDKKPESNESFVSESLANIMIKQGKFQRAIEIFERLILKNPEKSTYFATRIDELRQKSGE
jgi:tetratricopeptide (TPR) repeat protein